MMKKSSRISFTEQDSKHLYELSLEHFQEGCLKNRLENFIGKKDIKKIKDSVNKNGYCKD